MLRKFSLSLTVVLLLSSGALGAVGLAEGFSIDAVNSVTRTGCVGSAEGGNMVMVGHAQKAYDTWRGTAALQKETATLTQSASAVGSGGKQVVMQRASADGTQDQLVRAGGFAFGKRVAGQSLCVGLDTSISHVGAVGRAAGTQSLVGAQNQTEMTPNGISTGSQFVRAAQSAAVSGGSSSSVVVNNSLDVTLTQGRIVAGRI